MKKVKTVNKPKFTNTRKALRKEKRKQKKINRQDHYLRKKTDSIQSKKVVGKFVKRPADSPVLNDEPKNKKPKTKVDTIQDIILRQLNKEKKEANKLKSEMNDQRKKIMIKANEDEDKMIKKLEKQLKLNKSKNKNNYFADDGLDYLLEICDRATSEQIVAAEKHLADVDHDSDFEEDLAVVTGKEIPKRKNKKEKDKSENIHSDGSDEDTDIGDDVSDNEDEDQSGSDESFTDNDENEISEDNNESDNSVLDNDLERKSKHKSIATNKKSSKENIVAIAKDSESESDSNKSDSSEADEKSFKNLNKKQLSKDQKKSKPQSKSSKERIISEDDVSKVFSDDEVSDLSGDEDFSGDEIGNENNEISEVEENKKPDVWEDIYGRKRDKEGNIIKEEKGIYIPPHLRNKDSASDKELTQLKRQIKSVLNKLAGTNLHWACTSLESLYAGSSRHAVSSTLTQLWLEATVGAALTPDRMLAEHAALVALLHANVGEEIGAHFLEELCRKFDAMMRSPQPVGDKTLDNLVACLALLYSFKIYHASLLYDILTRLVEELTEKHIDCVLAALRNVGGVLRKEEPAALKAFIHDTQANIAKLNQPDSGSRIKFLLEVLLAVKNNNLNKIPNYDPSYVEELKKLSRGVVRRGNYVTTLNIRLDDLLKAHERGKWWVVGSAWEGNRVVEDKPTVKAPSTSDQRLLELARRQRMNTDVRRSIFCVIMAAEDYMDAFEKLQHLGLRGQQEREVVHVLLACCLQEKSYNPYYAVLGQKLCDHDRKYQLSIQYTVWDKIKELESLSKQSMANLAQFLIHLIMEKGLPLSVLKIIQFSDLNKTTVRFMRQILLAIIMNADLQASLQVFHRISKPPKLHMFRESLRLFIQHFLIKNAGKKATVLSEDEMATLKERAVEVDRILTLYENKLRL